jgi:hypothetical protein
MGRFSEVDIDRQNAAAEGSGTMTARKSSRAIRAIEVNGTEATGTAGRIALPAACRSSARWG